jgi:uncharacterized membrane protein YfcA
VATDALLLPLILAVTALVAGIVRGFAGFGGPMVLLPFATAILGPAAAVWVVILTDISVSLRLIPDVRYDAQKSVVVPLSIGTLVTMPAATLALVSLDADLMRRLICLAILIASLVMLSGWRSRRDLTTGQWYAVGGLAGIVMGLTSLGITAALFLQAGDTTARVARANFIIWLFVCSIALLALLAVQGGGPTGELWPFLAIAPAYFVGTLIGMRLFCIVSDTAGRRAILVLVAIIASVGLAR